MKLSWTSPFTLITALVFYAPIETGAQPEVDRQAIVRSAYENFVSTVYFLSASDRFIKDLTVEEKKQFELLGHKLIPHQFRFGPVQPGEFRTSRLVSNQLRFSNRNHDFILKAGEPPRTAKMDGDIWFNLNIINDPSSKFSILDANQILWHEFGHLIQDSEGKDQSAIDRVAAKIRKHLQSYVREIEVSPTIRMTTQLLPKLIYNDMVVDFQPEPIVLIAKEGTWFETRLPNNIDFTGNGYTTLHPNELHAIKRVDLSPSAEMDGERLLLRWRVEVGHFLVQSELMNFTELFSNLEKVRDRLPFEPLYTAKEVIQFVDLKNLVQDFPLKSFFENPVPTLSSQSLKWFEPLTGKGLKNGRYEYQGVVEFAGDLRDVVIFGQRKVDSIQFPGTVEKLTGHIYRLSFSIPSELTTTDSIFFTRLSVNGSDAAMLDEKIKLRPSALKPTSSLLPAKSTDVWDGKSWISANAIPSYDLATDDIRMRFHIKGATTLLNHIEVSWFVQEDVMLNGKAVGSRMLTVPEVIPASRLKQSFDAAGVLTMEFQSKRGALPTSETVGKAGFSLRDSGYRAFLQAQFVDQNLNFAHVPNKLTSSGWRSLFKLNPRPQTSSGPAAGKTCEGLFSTI